MANILRQALGNTIENISQLLKVPYEFGLSERIAGGPTGSTGLNAYASSGSSSSSSPYTASPVGPQSKNINMTPANQIPGSGYTSNYAINPSNVNTINYGGGSGSSDSRLQELQKTNRNPVQETEYQTLLEKLAGQQKSSSLDAIRSRLDEARNTARSLIDSGRSYRDDVLSRIASERQDLLGRSAARKGTALEKLGQEESRVGTDYAQANATARQRSQSAEMLNRQRARAMNRLDSSFYDDVQAQNTNDLTRGLGKLDLERLGALNALGTRKGETQQYFNEVDRDIENQSQNLISQAEQEYNQAVQRAQALERAGVGDFNENMAQAENSFQQNLAGIQNFVQNLAAQRQQIASQLSPLGNGIGSYNEITPELSSALGRNAYSQVSGYSPETINPVASNNQGMTLAQLLALSQQQRDPNLYQGLNG